LTRVAIFEDNKHLRETYELLLDNSPGYTCVGAYPDADTLVPLLEVNPCDIVLMDIEMPGMSGIEATRIVKQYFPGVLVLIQTVFSEDQHIFDAICAGASGYILKNTTPQGYLQAIADVRNGGSPMTPGIARRVLELFKANLDQPIYDDYNLSKQEKRVLQQLVTGKSYKLIASELFLSPDTIKTHVRNIYAKMQVHSGTEAVSVAIRNRLV
jgi:DNA-binding NarL/FixJ family response regulator